MKMKHATLAVLLLPSLLLAGGTSLQDGAGATLATVDANGNLRVSQGNSTRATYIASTSGNACSSAHTLSIEPSAGTGFKLAKWCANTSEATAGTGITVTVARRNTAASTGGTLLTAEGTGAVAISKMDPADANYPGIARLDGGLGTAGAVLDQVGFTTGEIGTGTETVPSYTFCQDYGSHGEKMPTVSAGVTNGLSINVSSAGAGGLSFCAISATIIYE